MSGQENPGQEAPADLRRAFDELKQKYDEAVAVNQQFAAERRTANTREMFRSRGYEDEHAELFLRTHEGDVTEEAIDGFVDRYKLSPSLPASADPTPDAGRNPDLHYPGANPMARAGVTTDGSVSNPRLLNYGQYQEAMQRDPMGTIRSLQAGEVKLLETNSAKAIAELPSRPQIPQPQSN